MRPPETALLGAGDVLGSVGDGVVQAMVGHPARGMTRAVEDRPEDQKLFDEPVGLESLVREHAVITNGGAESAESDEEQRPAADLKTRQGKEDQPDHRENVNQDEIGKDAFFAANRFPERPIPRPSLLRRAKFHFVSEELPRRLRAFGE